MNSNLWSASSFHADHLTISSENVCLNVRSLDYKNFEIIVLTEEPASLDGASVLVTGPVSPGRNRNIGASVAKGEIFAYIDADAYPRSDWLIESRWLLAEKKMWGLLAARD